MPSLSALPERLATCVCRHAACPFGGPARCGPLSSEERFGGSVCQSFWPERSCSRDQRALRLRRLHVGSALLTTSSLAASDALRRDCFSRAHFPVCDYPPVSRTSPCDLNRVASKTKASRRAGASGSREAKHLGRHPGLMVAARTKPMTK